MQLWALMIVRNEADILALNVLHHLSAGVDRFLIVDNGSADGTALVLERLARERPVRWMVERGPARQSEILTVLAREAYLAGADWVLPIDADEFWWSDTGTLRTELRNSHAGALRVDVINFVQRRSQETFSPRDLSHLNRRPPSQVGPVERAPDLVERREIGFVEMMYPPKWVSRATIALGIEEGNHEAFDLAGDRLPAQHLVCLHAPLRCRAVLAAKSQAADGMHGLYKDRWWHVRRWQDLAEAGLLDEEWAANSYVGDALDVYGAHHPLVRDSRLVDLAAPWLEASAGLATQAFAKAARAVVIAPEDDAGNRRLPLGPPDLSVDEALLAATLERIRGVDGWLRDEEARLLMATAWRAATTVRAASIVEIGSYCGKSTVALASIVKASGGGGCVHAIDPHEGAVGACDSGVGVTVGAPTLERLRRNLSDADVADVVEIVPQSSFDVTWTQPIELLFIDGLHDEASVRRDVGHFESCVAIHAYLVFHDCDDSFPGVKACVDEVLASGRYREVARAASLVVLQKLSAGESMPAGLPAVRASRLERGIRFLRRAIDERDERLAERGRAIDWLQSVVALRDAQLADREAGIEWLRSSLADLTASLAARDEAIQWLRSMLALRDVRVAELEKATASHDGRGTEHSAR
jgi:methyltransferase family protein/glycosyl transferase family 2